MDILKATDKGLVRTTVGFDNNSTITAAWTDIDKYLVVETKKRGNLELFDNYIWMINTKNEKTYLTNSFPVRNNFNTKIKPKINKNKDAILLSENGNNLWVISLLSSKIPVYEESGINFFNIDTKYEDSH